MKHCTSVWEIWLLFQAFPNLDLPGINLSLADLRPGTVMRIVGETRTSRVAIEEGDH